MSAATPSTPTLRIFISSPGDVAEEREKARQVLAQLQAFYGEQVLLVPVLWEDLPLELDQPFQNGIDVILKTHPIDIAVFILWSRLGSPLGKAVRDREGNPDRSGTEREFDLMLEALKQSGGKRPDILFYRRDDDPTFKRKLADEPDAGKMRELMTQSEMAQSFVQEHFQDEEGHNTRAYHRFRQPVEFASRLKVHLRGLIDQRIDAGETQRAARWTEAPYRGLEVFDLRHADIFFGREAEVCELETRLRQRETEGCAFVAVIGASGSGKSSLARAGLQASLTRFNLDQNVKEWRSAVLLPAQTEGQPLLGLIQVLPDLTKSGLSETEIAEAFAESPSTTVKTVLKPIFQPSTKNQEPITKLLVIVDQFEELFTDPRINPAERDRFLLALEALARSGFCWVVITMRSDFYPVAQKNEIFLRLKGENGHFDLLAPGPEALRRIITEPARMAGLRFEKRSPELGGQSLVGKILEDAKSQADLLPLLSDLLLELYQLRSPENIITFAAYESLGDKERTGLEGALSKRADKEFAKLTPEQQATCPEILHALVTVEADADVRRRANLAALRDTPQKAGLVDAFISARLLTADGPTVSLAHEALLRKWDRVADWVRDNRAFLRIRSRVEQALKRWSDAGNRPDLLLPEGLDLEEAAALLKDAPLLLAGSEYEPVRDYIIASQSHHETRRRRIEATRRTVTFFLVLLTLGALGFSGLALFALEKSLQARDDARVTEGNSALAKAENAPRSYPDQIFQRARAIGFAGYGGEDYVERNFATFWGEAYRLLRGEKEPYPVLLPKRVDLIRAELAELPAYLPFWRTEAFGKKVTGLAFAENDRYLLAKFEDGTVRRWDLRQPDGKPEVVKTEIPDSEVTTAALMEGTIVTYAGHGTAPVQLTGNPADATAWALDTDRKRLVIGLADGSVFAWDVSGRALGADRNLLELVQTRNWFTFDEAQDLAAGSRKEADLLAALWAEPEPMPFDPKSTQPFRNTLGMRMLYVAPGEFTMGSPETEEDRGDNETPHRVRLTQAFWLGQYEVTQAEWKAVMGENPSDRKDPLAPVTKVSWDDCQTFLAKLNQMAPLPAGWTYALPTEAQWEYACRAGTETPFSFGKVLDGTQANCDGSSPYGTTVNGPNLAQTVAVGRYSANPWGFYDLHGNVWEWCRDWYGDYEFKEGEVTVDPNGRASGEYRVRRGGCWLYDAGGCRSAYRYGGTPGFADDGLGFRVAAVPSPLHPDEKKPNGATE